MTISYAQNREDIYINWLLKGKKGGFYVDIGASDPTHLSVTKFFYERGWKGINVEPIKRYIDLLNSQRPEDINLMLGVAKEPGVLEFREYPDADGLSGFSQEMQNQYSEIKSIDYVVEVLPLMDILTNNLPVDISIDFMKIDVEGYEYEVIMSNDWDKFRPDLLVIEANHIFNDWHQVLQTYRYEKVFFDGLNEYFMPKELVNERLYDDFPDFVISANVVQHIQYIESQRSLLALVNEISELKRILNEGSIPLLLKSYLKSLIRKLAFKLKDNIKLKEFINNTPLLFQIKESARKSRIEKDSNFSQDASSASLLHPVSQLCTQNQFDEYIYEYWVKEIKEAKRYHRKQWEFVYILQSVATNGLLTPGKKALGFGVGQEPLPAVFAKNGVSVLGTDLETEFAVSNGWATTNQHAANLDDLNNREICDSKKFIDLVKFQFLDMNHIPPDLVDFDFCWSSCAFEHLGSIEAGLKFVENSLKCLKPGGWAIHTTEFNCQSDRDTLTSGGTVLFRKRDILELESRLKQNGHKIFLNLTLGGQGLDKHIDIPPYSDNYHLKLQLDKYVTTSIGLAIQKAR